MPQRATQAARRGGDPPPLVAKRLQGISGVFSACRARLASGHGEPWAATL
ncbi:MAG: hypothetical protein ACYC4U_14530 [Pirellulaceae bacterium]